MKPRTTIAIAGLGNRGKDTYAQIIKQLPDKAAIVAVADINRVKVDQVQAEYDLSEAQVYASAEQMLEQDRLADALIIATQDRQHVAQGIAALRKGYHLLLEKPISPDLKECQAIAKVAKQEQRQVIVCHVLRYTPFYNEVKKILDSGRIGQIVTVIGVENVGYWHMAHSFVRGNWRNAAQSSPMILQKSCHDMDILLWLTGKQPKSVSSFGSNFYFKAENAPAEATKRCRDCRRKQDCAYSGYRIYLTDPATGILAGNTDWSNKVLAERPTPENIAHALESGPYGRCVFYCDNNVVDHQVVNIQMTDGSTISFTMSGFSKDISRYTKFMGTRGEIIADMGKNIIQVTPFGETTTTIDVSELGQDFSGHGGGDAKMVEQFIDLIRQQKPMGEHVTSLERSLMSHYLALAAEASRQADGKVIEIADYISSLDETRS